MVCWTKPATVRQADPVDPPQPLSADAQALLDIARDPTLVIRHTDRRILAANPQAARIYGFESRQLCRLRYDDLVTDRTAVLAIFGQHRDHVPLRYHRRADGSHFPVELTIRWAAASGGEIGFFAIRDLSPQEDEARRVRATESMYRALFREAAFPILLLDRRGIVSEANDSALTLYRHTAATLVGVPLSELLLDNREARNYFRQPSSRFSQQRHRRQDGSVFLADVEVSLTRMSSDHHAVVVVRDVTEEQALLEKLQRSEARWRFAIEGHGDVLWEWDMLRGQLQVSRHLGDPLDAPTPGEHSRHYWESRVHPEDAPRLQLAMTEHISGLTDHIDIEMRMHTRDRGVRWVWMRGRVMERGPGGRPTRLLGSVRDIHDQRQQAEELALWREKVLHAARVTSLGEMATTLAHEMNQPLTSMRTFSAAALRRLDQPELRDLGEIRRLIGLVADEAMRAGRIMQHMRSFVRKGPMHSTPLGINELVLDVQRLTEQRIRRLDVRIRLALSPALPPIRADRVLMEQLLINLVHNAAEALGTGDTAGREREIEISTLSIGASQIGIDIRDTGPGLPEPLLKDLFTPFFTTRPEGLGLGLTICRSIVESHQGQLSAENPAGGGALFHIILPAMPQDRSDDPAP